MCTKADDSLDICVIMFCIHFILLWCMLVPKTWQILTRIIIPRACYYRTLLSLLRAVGGITCSKIIDVWLPLDLTLPARPVTWNYGGNNMTRIRINFVILTPS